VDKSLADGGVAEIVLVGEGIGVEGEIGDCPQGTVTYLVQESRFYCEVRAESGVKPPHSKAPSAQKGKPILCVICGASTLGR
jgi:hypothetical protein